MRDPRTLGPYNPNRLPSIVDMLEGGGAAVPAAAMAQAAEPAPTIGSRIAGLASGVGNVISALPPVNLFSSLNSALQSGREQNQLKSDQMRADLEAAGRRAQLEQAQLPAQQAMAAAQARQLSAIDSELGSEQDPRRRQALIRGAASGTFRPFELEPGPAELAAYENVLGMQQEEARQRLIGQREQRQAGFDAQLQRETYAQNRAQDLELEKGKRSLGPAAGDIKANQWTAAGYGRRVEQAIRDLDQIQQDGFRREEYTPSFRSYLPGGTKPEALKLQEQAESNFINSVLRRESGAAISPGEFDRAEQQYFPRAGDTEKVLKQKEQNRLQTLANLRAESGAAWEATPLVDAASGPNKPPAPAGGTTNIEALLEKYK